jgi:Cu(I)/Ag(I) efflux system periplasmic protein CusF
MKTIMKTLALAAMLATAITAPSYAQQQAADNSAQTTAQAQAEVALADGEIRKVNPETKKLTIRHGPLVKLGMPPMTMVFRVKDPAMLNTLNRGDKIKFSAEKINGAYTVTHIEPAR